MLSLNNFLLELYLFINNHEALVFTTLVLAGGLLIILEIFDRNVSK